MSNFLQYTVFGVMYGAGYAIAATGLVVTYTTSGVFNFAQGAVGMIAAFCYWGLVTQDHVNVLVALLIILVVGASVSGALVERVLMRRLHGASAERPVMVTLGLLVILTGLATIIWSPTTQRSVNNMVGGQFRLVGINIQYQEVLIIGVALAVAVALRLLFYSTRTGVALRAVVDDPQLLAMSGVSPNRMSQYGWVLGFVMAALAGVLLAPTQTTGIEHPGHDPPGGQRVCRGHRRTAQEHTGDLRRGHRDRPGRELRHQLHPAPRPAEPGPGHHLRPPHGVPVHRPGHPAVGPAQGGGPPDHRASPRVAGGKESLLAGVVFFVVAVVVALVFNNKGFEGHHRAPTGRGGDDAGHRGPFAGAPRRLFGPDLPVPVLLHGYRRLRHGQGRRWRLTARTGGGHRHLCGSRGAHRTSDHPTPRPLSGPCHLRLCRCHGPGVLHRYPHLRIRRV